MGPSSTPPRSDELLARFNRAVALHSGGGLADARAEYEVLIRLLPRHPALLDLYGTLLHQLGEHDAACGFLQRSVAGNPLSSGAWNHLGSARRAQGRVPIAMKEFRRSAIIDPAAPEPLINICIVDRALGDNAGSIKAGLAALSIRADLPDVLVQIGAASVAANRLDSAVGHLRRARKLEPIRPDVHLHLSTALGAAGDVEGALRAARTGIVTNPGVHELYPRLIGARDPEIEENPYVSWSRYATRLRPGEVRLWANHAAELYGSGQFAMGLREARRATILGPADRSALQNLIAASFHLNEYDLGRWAARCALAAHPGSPDLVFAASEVEFVVGDLRRAWDLYEARTARAGVPIRLGLPGRWHGLGTETGPLLVAAEQGIGDEAVFLSCLPDLVEQVDVPIVVEVDSRLVPVFQRSFPSIVTVPRQTDPANPGRRVLDYRELVAREGIREFTYCGSLPRHFRTDRDRPSARGGYLVPDPELTSRWRSVLEAFRGTTLVGVAWRSAKMNRFRARFHADIADWEPVFRVPGCTFVSLMPGDVEDECSIVRERFGTEIHCFEQLDAWGDIEGLLALMALLDVVVVARTATCAFAGAIGVPTIRVAPSFNRITDGRDLFFANMIPVLGRTEPFDGGVAAEAAARLLRERAGATT